MSERGKIILPSTEKALKAGGVNFKNFHGYFYARFSKQYIGGLIKIIFPYFSKSFKNKIAERYHGKILTHEQAEAIIKHDHSTQLHSHDLEKVIPYPIARNLILNGPPDLAIYECVCRHNRKNPCQPTRVCMIVGQPFVDFVLEHKPEESQRITKDEGLKILLEEHQRGHVHTAWFKDLCLDRFFAICNCCKCCCGGIEAMMKFHVPILISSGYSAKVDSKKCSGCGICEKNCSFSAAKIINQKSEIDTKKCMGCGVCKDLCPTKAIAFFRDSNKPNSLEIDKL
ncbi:hypothetical protein A3F08_02645 [Candidatus Berkelbacteria bacterium RIFCSPHIGHO2_12_FULL_36_9]|uniref:4Fe-4S ferredoxin-type domain-containing protein n=1 Tax=Candidatus Berkelbacteria bacterium RIFCSPHIGHO2_12_FULL_36_9 TaxID=1797469 RepID=A0A1F5EDT4_9BACT|nr:MAG: hypothetical protein A3F08_02645 [Candidatus Berkelbacteria bacterium RIFCSPHIGHO2_12_FULL_36_9]